MKVTNQQRIWQVVELIPLGKVSSYGVIADLAGLSGRARFVSTAMRQVPKELELPWHRVVNAQGKISIPKYNPLYQVQRQLLEQENILVLNGKIDMARFAWEPDLMEIMFSLEF
jgi:methylated-DNA-protein-cysteine methyltransferase-like protein